MPTTAPTKIDPAQVARAETMLAALREANPKHRFARSVSGVSIGVWWREPGCFSVCYFWLSGDGADSWVAVENRRDVPNIDPGVKEWVE